MSIQRKTATRLALCVLGLAALPLTVKAGEGEYLKYHVDVDATNQKFASYIVGGDLNGFVNLSSFVGDGSPDIQLSVTAPKVSGIDLFSHQATFSLSGMSFLENTPVSAMSTNADAIAFLQAAPSVQSVLSIGMDYVDSTVVSPSLSLESSTYTATKYQLPVNDAGLYSAESPAALAAPAAHGSESASLSRTSLLVADGSHIVEAARIASVSATPEPATLATFSIAAVGLLMRRRRA